MLVLVLLLGLLVLVRVWIRFKARPGGIEDVRIELGEMVEHGGG